MKKLVALALGTVMAVSMTAGVSQHHKLKIRYYTFILSC